MADYRINIGAKHPKLLTGHVHCGVLMEMKGKKYSYCFVVLSKGANDICLYCFENQFSSKAQYVLCMKDFEKYVALDWLKEINKAIDNSYTITNNDSGFGSASSAGKDDLHQQPEGPYSNVRSDGSFSSIAPDHDLSVPEEQDYEPHSRSIRNTEQSSESLLEQLDTRKPLPTPRQDAHVYKTDSPKKGSGMPLTATSKGAISEDVVTCTSEYMHRETEQHVSKREEEVLHTSNIKPETERVLMRSNTGKRETDRRRVQMLPEDPSTVTDSGVGDEPVTIPYISSNNKRGSSGSSFESVRSGASDHDTVSDKTKDTYAVENVDKGGHDGSR